MNFKQDIKPITDFRQHAKDILTHARNSRRPIVVTQRGKASAVLLDIDEYQKQLDRMETLEMIAAGEAAVRRGEVQSHDEVMQEMDSWLAEK